MVVIRTDSREFRESQEFRDDQDFRGVGHKFTAPF